MNGATTIPRRPSNYGSAVAAIPLVLGGVSFVDPPSSITSFEQVLPMAHGTQASSDIGRWLDSRWESISSDVTSVLSRIAIALAETSGGDLYWFEVPDDALLPTLHFESLDVEIVEGSQAEPFRFTDTDFDVWI